ncbi:hypothetical protein X749_14990 [Mesorhizobium sp. LNJC391B00]|nr:hypothetical protein X749_14990 [Mesorhizobium sp. LNJC391B00]
MHDSVLERLRMRDETGGGRGVMARVYRVGVGGGLAGA